MVINKRYLIFIFLLLGVGLSVYLLWLTGYQQTQHRKAPSHRLDWKAENIVTTQFSKKGAIKNQLISPHVTHYPATNTAVLVSPQLMLFSPDAKPWRVTAKKAVVNGGLESKASTVIELVGNVVIHQNAGTHNDAETITTTRLSIYPNQQIAKTKQPIVIQQKSNDGSVTIVKAVGATVNQKTGIIRLLSHVRGSYAKKPNA